jgi:hypothetical protein
LSRSARLLLPAASGAAAALAMASGIGRRPLLGDNQHFFYLAERTASGVSPYVAHVEPVAALNVLLEGAGIALGRLAGVDDLAAARVVSIAVLALAAALVVRLAVVLAGRNRAGVIAALAILSATPFIRAGAMSGQPKVALVALTAAALLADATGRPALAGALAGCAFVTYQPGLLVVAGILAAHLLGGRGWRIAVRTLAGFAAPVVVYEAYFVVAGGLARQIECNVVIPVLYLRGGLHGMSYYREALSTWRSAYGFGSAVVVLAAATFVGQWAGWLRSRSLREALDSPWLPLHLAGAATAAYHLYDHQGVPDTFRLLPFIVPLAAAGTVAAAAWLRRRATAVGIAAEGAVALTLLAVAASGAFTGPRAKALPAQREVARAVSAYLGEGGGVWAVGCTHLLAFNHAANWLPYGFFFRGLNSYLTAESGRPTFTPERGGAWPRYILESRGLPAGNAQWLAQRYERIAPEGFAGQGIRVFRLRAAAP